jgi:hypothetical protein
MYLPQSNFAFGIKAGKDTKNPRRIMLLGIPVKRCYQQRINTGFVPFQVLPACTFCRRLFLILPETFSNFSKGKT